jgi:uncharacterized lipoprotein YajG
MKLKLFPTVIIFLAGCAAPQTQVPLQSGFAQARAGMVTTTTTGSVQSTVVKIK